MNNYLFKICLFLLCVAYFNVAHAQREQVDQVTLFSSRSKNPIKVEVERQNEQIIFYGVNKSFIPYQVELTFKDMINLDPYMRSYEANLHFGKTKLFTLKVRDRSMPHDYSYTIQYRMGNPKAKPDEDFPYLIPISKNKTVRCNAVRMLSGGAPPALLKIDAGDTIYAMRKGRVTATPVDDVDIDRITKASIELYQGDGTIASYYLLDLKSMVKDGEIVYPGQPIGIASEEGVLRIYVFQFAENGKVQSTSVKYVTDGNALVTSDKLNGVICTHPSEVIKRELTKSETKKLEKHTLY